MPTVKEAGLRHATHYTEFTKRHQSNREAVVMELPNLMGAYRFLAGANGAYDRRLVDLAIAARPVLDAEVYWGDLILMLEGAQRACARSEDNITQAQLLSILAQMYNNTGSYDAALAAARESVLLAQRTRQLEILADAHLRLGWTCLYLAEFARSVKHLRKSGWFARRTERLDILASSLHFTSRAYFEKGDYQLALSYFRAQLALPQEANGLGAWAYTWLRGAEILLELGKVRLAKRIIRGILRQFQVGALGGNAAPYWRALARAEFKEGKVEAALALLNESLKRIGYVRGEMNVRQDMVEVYIALGELEAAFRLISEVIKYRESAKERRQLADALYLKGRIMEERGNLVEAAESYKESLHIFDKIGCLATVSERVRVALGRSESALYVQQKGFTHERK